MISGLTLFPSDSQPILTAPMRTPWKALMLMMALAGTSAAGWAWGPAGAGLTLAMLASGSIGYLARRRPLPAPELGPPLTTVPTSSPNSQPQVEAEVLHARHEVHLQLIREIAEHARSAEALGQALARGGEALHRGARAWAALQVEGWNGESGSLRPWSHQAGSEPEHIDVTAIAPTHRKDRPLGQALGTLKPTVSDLRQSPGTPSPWRAAGTQRVLALPVSVDGWPLAMLEFDDPARAHADVEAVLEVAAIQLGFVAQRDANRARMASHEEHLGRLALVASRISSGVAITDREGTIEWINAAFVALTGWPEERVLGRKLPELLAQEVSDADTVNELQTQLERGVPFRVSYEAGRQGAQTLTRYWGEIDAIQMLDETGGRNQYVCLFTDITKRKAQEHVRDQEREFLEALLGNMPVSLFVLDPVNLNVVAINRYNEIEFSLQRDRVVGRSFEQALGKSVMGLTQPHMQQAVDSGETVEHDFTWQGESGMRVVNARHFALRHSNGRPRLLFSLVVPEATPLLREQEAQERLGINTDTLLRLQIPGKGLRWMRHRSRTRHLPDGATRVYGLVSDVTDERNQALELQRARDMAEAASQAKSQFMANMSHEIRTPMNGILGMTELLLGTPLNDKQRRFAQAVYRSGESLLEIINDILDFAKIEAGRLELANSDFVLRTLVEDTLELMAPRAHEKGLELSFREQPCLPSVIHGDPLRLRQILTNLVANAIKFTEPGEVVVDIRRGMGGTVHSSVPSEDKHIELEFMVRDTGIGIPSEVIPRLFSAFVQANVGMARRYGGTGLGLAISKQLVELMGGHIEAHSAPGDVGL